jgi:hypothetical protein
MYEWLEMATMKPAKKEPPKFRSAMALAMFMQFAGKGGPMRDRRQRRPKDAKHSWKRDQDA